MSPAVLADGRFVSYCSCQRVPSSIRPSLLIAIAVGHGKMRRGRHMRLEPQARRPDFVEGFWVELADGQRWSLPGVNPEICDAELGELRSAVAQAEDAAERFRAELAAVILLLSRNYE